MSDGISWAYEQREREQYRNGLEKHKKVKRENIYNAALKLDKILYTLDTNENISLPKYEWDKIQEARELIKTILGEK